MPEVARAGAADALNTGANYRVRERERERGSNERRVREGEGGTERERRGRSGEGGWGGRWGKGSNGPTPPGQLCAAGAADDALSTKSQLTELG